jgi:DNA-binding MarR family transcriptional regulator
MHVDGRPSALRSPEHATFIAVVSRGSRNGARQKVVAYYNDGIMQKMATPTTADPQHPGSDRDEVVDGVLGASRALVAVAARSLATVADDVTLAQYRVLIELASHGPQRLADLASALHVDRSTATRMCDRLVRKRLVARRRTSEDRRGVRISLTRTGAELVAEVSRRRRAEIGRIVERMPSSHRPLVVEALRAFADAAGEVPEQDWSLGWNLDA